MMDNMPLVSVIVSTYNREKQIADTLGSILGQSYKNIEIIVVDDGSTDNTKQVVAAYSDVIYIYQENRERAAARNNGIRNSTGDFIVIMDSDDLLPETMIEDCLKCFHENRDKDVNNKKLGVVFGQMVHVDQDRRELGRRYHTRPPDGDLTLEMARKSIVCVTALALRECYEQSGFFNETRALSGSEDYELWFRVSLKYSFMYIDVPTLYYVIHGNQTATFPDRNFKNLKLAHDLIFAEGPDYEKIKALKPESLSNVYRFTANNHYAAGNRSGYFVNYLRAISLYPGMLFEWRTLLFPVKALFGRKFLMWIKRAVT